MAFSAGGQQDDFSEINITPLTDVFLILFLIMIVIAPLINQTALKLEPPKAQNGKNISSKVKAITLEISADGLIAINGKKLSETPFEPEQVGPAVEAALKELIALPEYKDSPLNIVTDADTRQKFVVGAMDAAAGLGLAKMSIVTVSGM
ncbi:MAG: biopolymer transporter ExbD [Candidatus Caenarcaniphilales bacterium]|jgi:biopolymer transport protein ExbD/biopolymer transport protein TolR|nr:biopolymer transporter ExbD [Candidatus Caenarcaniphilales bacterium]